MNKATTTLLFSLLISISSYAQKVDWGKIQQKQGGALYIQCKPIGHDDESYYVMSFPFGNRSMASNGGEIIRYDLNSHKKLSKQKLEYKGNRSYLELEGIASLGKNHYAYFYDYNKKEKKLDFLVAKIENGKIPEPKSVYTSEFNYDKSIEIKTYGYGSVSELAGSDHLIISKSGNHAALLLDKSNEEEGKEFFNVIVFDAEFNVVWEKEHTLKHFDIDAWIYDAAITDDGDIYATAKIFSDEKSKKIINYHFEVLKISKDGLTQHKIQLDGKKAHKIALIPNHKNKQIHILGTFNDEGKKDLANGFFNYTLDEQLNLVKSTVHPFTSELKEKAFSKRNKDAEFKHPLKIGSIVLHSNNEISLIAISEEIVGDYMESTHIIYYRIDRENNLLKMEQLTRRFSEDTDGYCPFSTNIHVSDGKLYLVFNDDKRLDSDRTGISHPQIVVINEEGFVVKRELIYDRKKEKLNLMPSYSFKVKDRFFLWCEMRKNYKVGELITD